MQTKYKFIHFIQIVKKAKTFVWSCCNNRSGDEIGAIAWYGAWRQYCFFPKGFTVYSKGCLDDINSFITSVESERKKK